MNKELKVSFYLKRESRLEKNAVGENVIYPIIGKIIIGNSIAQFSTKLKIEERLWHVKSGRATGKSHTAVKLSREIKRTGKPIKRGFKKIVKLCPKARKHLRLRWILVVHKHNKMPRLVSPEILRF